MSAHPELADLCMVFERDLATGVAAYLELQTQAVEAVVFAEYLGEGSFAGQHPPGAQMRLIIIDVLLDKVAFMDLVTFVRELRHLPIPRVVWQGKLTGQFAEDLRQGRFGVEEGVVCKGVRGDWRCKIKTNDYARRLRKSFGDRWDAHWE